MASLWRTTWYALSCRIEALVDVGSRYLAAVQAWGSDYYGVGNDIVQDGQNIVRDLERFHRDFHSVLPPIARDYIKGFLDKYKHRHRKFSGIPGVQATLTMLGALRGELNYLLSTHVDASRNLVSRAFLHLQRSIVADERIGASWKDAFRAGEPACEALGAAHLLLHGIWAFKASATGERTDLVMGTPLAITAEIERASEALVLTEWKVIRKEDKMETKAQQALVQAKRYSAGVLAGFELSTIRYLVLVTKDIRDVPPPIIEGDVTYEYILVAVSPAAPSRSLPPKKLLETTAE